MMIMDNNEYSNINKTEGIIYGKSGESITIGGDKASFMTHIVDNRSSIDEGDEFSLGDFTVNDASVEAPYHVVLYRNTYGIDPADLYVETPIVLTTSIFSKNYYAGLLLENIKNFANTNGRGIYACKFDDEYIFTSYMRMHKYGSEDDLFSTADYLHPALLDPNKSGKVFLKYLKKDYYKTINDSSPLHNILYGDKEQKLDKGDVHNIYYSQKGPDSFQDYNKASDILPLGTDESAGLDNSKFYLLSLEVYFKVYDNKNNVIERNENAPDDVLDTSISFYTSSDNGGELCIKDNVMLSSKDKVEYDSSTKTYKIKIENIQNNVAYIGFSKGMKEHYNVHYKNMSFDVSYLHNADKTDVNDVNKSGCINLNIYTYLKIRTSYNFDSSKRPSKIELVKVVPTYLDNLSCNLKYVFSALDINTNEKAGYDDYTTKLTVKHPFFNLFNKNDNEFKYFDSSYLFDGSSTNNNKQENINADTSTNDNAKQIPSSSDDKFLNKDFIYNIVLNSNHIKYSLDYKNIKYDGIPVTNLFKEMPMTFEDETSTHVIDMNISCSLKGVEELNQNQTKIDSSTFALMDVLAYDSDDARKHSNSTILFKYTNDKAILCTLPFYDVKEYLSDESSADITSYKVKDMSLKDMNNEFVDITCDFVRDSSNNISYNKTWDLVFAENGDILRKTPRIDFMVNLNLKFKNSDKLARILDVRLGINHDNITDVVKTSEIFTDLYLTANKSAITNEFNFNKTNKKINDSSLYNKDDNFIKDEIYNIGEDNNNDNSNEVTLTNKNAKYAILVLDNETCEVTMFSTDDIANIKDKFGQCLTDRYSLYATKIKTIKNANGYITYPKIIN